MKLTGRVPRRATAAVAISTRRGSRVEAERVGGVVEDSDVIDVGGHEAARFTIAQDDSDTSGETSQMLVINGGDRIYRVTTKTAVQRQRATATPSSSHSHSPERRHGQKRLGRSASERSA